MRLAAAVSSSPAIALIPNGLRYELHQRQAIEQRRGATTRLGFRAERMQAETTIRYVPWRSGLTNFCLKSVISAQSTA
jgi:hypothetical protein